jgi:hypothetical protein
VKTVVLPFLEGAEKARKYGDSGQLRGNSFPTSRPDEKVALVLPDDKEDRRSCYCCGSRFRSWEGPMPGRHIINRQVESALPMRPTFSMDREWLIR